MRTSLWRENFFEDLLTGTVLVRCELYDALISIFLEWLVRSFVGRLLCTASPAILHGLVVETHLRGF